eukprot:1336915-Rhodomonas_salina.2
MHLRLAVNQGEQPTLRMSLPLQFSHVLPIAVRCTFKGYGFVKGSPPFDESEQAEGTQHAQDIKPRN